MKNNKELTCNSLSVTAANFTEDKDNTYVFKAYEFENGLILVPGDTTNDWFFETKENIQACGNDEIISIKEDGLTFWTAKDLLESVQGSIKEFGVDSVPSKHLELWK